MGMEIEVTKAAQVEEALMSDKENKATAASILTKDNSDPVARGAEMETAKKEGGTEVAQSSILPPKDATDEWGAPKQTHTFFFPKVRMAEDPKVKTKLDHLHKTINTNKAQKGNLLSQLADKRKERNEIIQQLKPLTEKIRELSRMLNEKRTAMEPLRGELDKIRSENNAIREKGMGLCSSVKDLDNLLKSLEYRMSHESMSLNEEKRLMKEIKQLEGTRAQVIAHEASRAKLDNDTEKDALQGKVKLIGADMDEVRKERESIRAKIKPLEDAKAPIDAAIKNLEDQLNEINERNNKNYNSIVELNSGKESLNTVFTENRKMLTQAKVLASKKDIAALETFANTEMEKFMAQWAKKAFRVDYENRILLSLDQRFLSRDGRIRNPDEKPILAPEPVKVAQPEPSPVPTPLPKPALPKHSKEKEAVAKADEEVKAKGIANLEADSMKEKEKEKEKEKKEKEKVDLEKLKLKREEEIAKNKLAMERKKKLAEKKQAKAEAKAAKEAEEKLKKKEKKAKKKGAPEGSEDVAEPEPNPEEAVEPEDEPKEESNPVSAKSKAPKENSSTVVRPRGGVKKNQLPRAILRKKKSHSIWSSWTSMSAVAVGVLAVLLGLFAYYYKYHYLANKKIEA